MKPFRLTHPPKPRESDVIRGCLAEMIRRNYWPARLHAGTFRSVDQKRWIKGVAKGTPDYGAIHEFYPGFLLETKRPGEELRDEQEFKQWEIRAGYRLAICTVDRAESLATWLDAHEARAKERWSRLLAMPTRAP